MITEFEQVMREHLDYNDPENIHEVARVLREADTDAQNRMLEAVTSKMYSLIQQKADKIDFSSIAKSRGDFTKIQNYDSLMECCDVIRRFITGYHENLSSIDTVDAAINNIKNRTDMFKRAFVINSPIATMTYNSMSLGCVYSISFLIATCIEYIKDPKTGSYQAAINKVALRNTDKNLMFNSLRDFNKSCSSGEFDTAMDVAMKQGRARHEAVDLITRVDIAGDHPVLDDSDYADGKTVIHDTDDTDGIDALGIDSVQQEGVAGYLISRAFIFIAKLLIPMIRNVVYLFYHTKQKISDFYAQQAQLLEMNAYQLQYSTEYDEEEKQKIFNKQMKIVARWKHNAQIFDVDYRSAKKSAEDDASDEAQQYTHDETGYNDNEEGEYSPSTDGGIF